MNIAAAPAAAPIIIPSPSIFMPQPDEASALGSE